MCNIAQSTEVWLYFILVAAGGPRYVNNYDKDGYKNDHLGKKCKEMQDYVERELIYYHELLENTPEKLDYLNDINVI